MKFCAVRIVRSELAPSESPSGRYHRYHGFGLTRSRVSCAGASSSPKLVKVKAYRVQVHGVIRFCAKVCNCVCPLPKCFRSGKSGLCVGISYAWACIYFAYVLVFDMRGDCIYLEFSEGWGARFWGLCCDDQVWFALVSTRLCY